VRISVYGPQDLDALADELARVVARHETFTLVVDGPPTVAAWQKLLWEAPTARRRLRRLRPALAAWCDHAVHVVRDPAAIEPHDLRLAQLVWGCQTTVAAEPAVRAAA